MSSERERDRVFEVVGSTLRFGPGAVEELGPELADRGLRRVLLVTDAKLATLPAVARALDSLDHAKIKAVLFDRVRIEPTDRSFMEAARFALEGDVDAFVAVGGGSSIDTAKAANLYSTYPADFWEYVYPPLGKGTPIPGPLKPLFAVPTTAGTGSETTGVAIFDVEGKGNKNALSHRLLRPTLAIIDPDLTRTLPSAVAASSGLDVLCHAIESHTAIDSSSRPKPARPGLRGTYQGANPVSDVWSLEALRLAATALPRAVRDPSDDEARSQMLLAAAYAGIGFGNAGVHLPHAMSYPIAGQVKTYLPPGYDVDHPMVPHGMSVILTAPAVVRFIATARPDRVNHCAQLLGAPASKTDSSAGERLAERLTSLMQQLGMPNGLSEIGYRSEDIPKLAEGTLPQSRLTSLSPRPASVDEIARLFEDSMTLK